ncbi:hypothetical protein L1987_14273 [Smallanthus sonchifolius]|uniref:Uncharacterized protein n=1 Tax=Smallanthus sonchifolius TaxID=185202 RepID=A0ACB9J5U1_9ASTR|nr:hypothetical protein L1987_14273 [Smallanthus sonchifolius]
MSSSTIRKVIGVVKDQTSISIAKVAGNVAPDLEVLIVKATGHDSEPAEEKYIREILHLISQSRGYALSNYWDHSGFVMNYALYLDQKLEFIAFERKLSPTGFRDDHGYEISHKSKSYGDLYDSVVRRDKKETKMAITPVREMKPDRVLERLNKLLRLIDRVLSCRPAGNAKSSKMVLAALYLVLNERFWIYADICEALGVLLDRFPEMEYGNCVRTFDQYVNAAKTIDELVDFYSWSKELGVARASEFPEVQKVTDKILGTLEIFLREKTNKLKKNMEEGYKENGPSPPATVAETEDLLNLKDDIVPPANNHGNTLAISLFSGPKTVGNTGSWDVFSSTSESDKAAVWRTPMVAGGKADWELALVESTSNPSRKKAGGGLDPVMLNGMYDQAAVTQHIGYSEVWQPYGSNVGRINGGVATYNGMGKQAGYNYAHY